MILCKIEVFKYYFILFIHIQVKMQKIFQTLKNNYILYSYNMQKYLNI